MGWTTRILFLAGKNIFLFTTTSRSTQRPTHNPIQCSPGIKWSGCEAYHSPPPSDEVKNTWSYASIPLHLDGVAVINIDLTMPTMQWII